MADVYVDGAKCADLCRKHGMSEGTFYAGKAFGMTVPKGCHCCAIGPSDDGDAAEGAGGRKCQADAASGRTDAGHGGNAGASSKEVVTPAVKREAVAHLQAHLGRSERLACQIAGADCKMKRYQSHRAPDRALQGRLRDLVNERRRFGYRRLFVLLRRGGETLGINRIYRLYREEGYGAQAEGLTQGCRRMGANPDRGTSQCQVQLGARKGLSNHARCLGIKRHSR